MFDNVGLKFTTMDIMFFNFTLQPKCSKLFNVICFQVKVSMHFLTVLFFINKNKLEFYAQVLNFKYDYYLSSAKTRTGEKRKKEKEVAQNFAGSYHCGIILF